MPVLDPEGEHLGGAAAAGRLRRATRPRDGLRRRPAHARHRPRHGVRARLRPRRRRDHAREARAAGRARPRASRTKSRPRRRSSWNRTRSTSWSSPGHSDESTRRTSCTSWVRWSQQSSPAGSVFDLQVIRPNPVVEVDGRVVCEIDGGPLFIAADATTAAVDDLVHRGALIEEAIDDHDVREHYDDGADLVAAYATKRRKLPRDELPALRALARPVCRTRTLPPAPSPRELATAPASRCPRDDRGAPLPERPNGRCCVIRFGWASIGAGSKRDEGRACCQERTKPLQTSTSPCSSRRPPASSAGSPACGDYRRCPASCGNLRSIRVRDLRGMERSRRSIAPDSTTKAC